MTEHNKPEKWIDEFYSLYRKGRKSGAPQSYIDYFEARRFISSLLSTIKSEVEKKVKVHLDVERSRTSSKKDWHEGNRNALYDVIELIEKHQNE